MASLQTEADPVIKEVMKDKGVSTDEIPSETPFKMSDLALVRKNSRRYFHTKAFGSYECNCSRGWKSAHSWCMTDLKTQRFFEKFTQDCQRCERKVEPLFDLQAKHRMAEYAVDTYLRRSGRVQSRPSYGFDMSDLFDVLPDSNGPHDQARCQTCKILGMPCWN